LKVLPLSKWTQYLSFMRNFTKSESLLNPLMRSPAEWCGMSGLTYADAKKFYPRVVNVYLHWKEESALRNDWGLFDFKTSILTSVTASELHIRKARNFADSVSANMVLPFANERLASYFSNIPEQYLFDRKTLKNKLILRKILKDRIDLDSDALGKMGFTYDTRGLVLQNWDWMNSEILGCTLWDQPGLVNVILRMKKRMSGHGWGAGAAGRFLYRIYLISAWHNHNMFLK